MDCDYSREVRRVMAFVHAVAQDLEDESLLIFVRAISLQTPMHQSWLLDIANDESH